MVLGCFRGVPEGDRVADRCPTRRVDAAAKTIAGAVGGNISVLGSIVSDGTAVHGTAFVQVNTTAVEGRRVVVNQTVLNRTAKSNMDTATVGGCGHVVPH